MSDDARVHIAELLWLKLALVSLPTVVASVVVALALPVSVAVDPPGGGQPVSPSTIDARSSAASLGPLAL